MNFVAYHNSNSPTVMLIPGLGVSYEIFLPLIELLKERYCIIGVEVDGFVLGRHTRFTSIDAAASEIIRYIQKEYAGRIDVIYGLSMGGKILSRILERNDIIVGHAIMDAAPLKALPRWLVGPLRYLQAGNVWTCFHWDVFWRWVFHSHYFDVLLDECKKIYPYGGVRAVLDGYQSVYSSTLQEIHEDDIQYWYGTKEAFVARSQVQHLLRLHPGCRIEVFKGLNHGQLLIDFPEEIAKRIDNILSSAL